MGSRYHSDRRNSFPHRRLLNRPVRPIIVIVCDDTDTAVNYFNPIKQQYKTSVTIHVIPAPRDGALPGELLKYADKQRQKHEPDTVWLLLDREIEPQKQQQADKIKKQARPPIHVALSNPCFEVWTLAHFINTGKTFTSCDDVLKELKSAWKKEFKQDFPANKAQADYGKLIPIHLDKAIKHARQQHEAKTSTSSWTQIYQLIEMILHLHAKSTKQS